MEKFLTRWKSKGGWTCWLIKIYKLMMAKRLTPSKQHHEESSESENETEPAKIFHRRLSTNAQSSVSIKYFYNIHHSCNLLFPFNIDCHLMALSPLTYVWLSACAYMFLLSLETWTMFVVTLYLFPLSMFASKT